MSTTLKSPPAPPSTHHSVAASIHSGTKSSNYGVYSGHSITSSQSSNNTSIKMSSPQTTHTSRASQPYMLIPDLYIADSTASEIDLNSTSWMVTTVIEDDDLMFGGKPLSAWYEEDRRRFSIGDDDEEERRGRQRERVRVDTHHHHHYHNHQHKHHHHAKKGKELKQ